MNVKIEDRPLDQLLAGENVDKKIVEIITENFDEALAAGVPELTQREDVREWIRNPRTIQKIQPSLADFVRMLKLHDGPASVLDVGCYGGYVYDYLCEAGLDRDPGFKYTGIDIQEHVIEAARYMHRGKTNVSFHQCDMFRLEQEFSPQAFDFVICSRVLVQVPYFTRALRNLYAVAGDAVMVILGVADKSQAEKAARINLDTGKTQYVWFRYFTVKELDEAAKELGADFRVIQGPRPYASYVLYR